MTDEKQVKVKLSRAAVEYLSLKNDNYCSSTNIAIIPKIIEHIKIGDRLTAIDLLLRENIDYNSAINYVKYCENNLNTIIKDNPKLWWIDNFGKYEFLPIQDLFQYKQNYNYNTHKTELEICCEAIDLRDWVSSKDPTVVQSKSQAVVQRYAKIWYKEFNNYHLEREKDIISCIKEQQENILYDALSDKSLTYIWSRIKRYNRLFESKIPVVEKPYCELTNTKKIEYELNRLENNPPGKDIPYLPIVKRLFRYFIFFFNKNYEIEEWKKDCSRKKAELDFAEKTNKEKTEIYNQELEKYSEYKKQVEQEEAEYKRLCKEEEIQIKKKKELIKNSDSATIEEYFGYVLTYSIYPILFNKDFAINYNNVNKILVLDYFLPSIEDIYNIKTINYSVTKDEYKITTLLEKELNGLFDKTVYKICFRTIHELFLADMDNNIDAIVFNGYTKGFNKTNGQSHTVCIISIQVSKEDFKNINLEKIDPKACFKSLKGVSTAELSALTPIRPIMQLNKNDKRFVEAYGVLDSMDEGMNLATMDWQDFENLIREVFEKYFSQDGNAEVRVTQSSRDGGVDAVVFDPDPIRGGKIVIQAKRYTNVVGVSAVRDLYGTVINEGAIKGILVTTADFGSDSHEFVKDKPISLINGNNLLYLLEQYGYNARININEAKEYFKNNDIKPNANKSY